MVLLIKTCQPSIFTKTRTFLWKKYTISIANKSGPMLKSLSEISKKSTSGDNHERCSFYSIFRRGVFLANNFV